MDQIFAHTRRELEHFFSIYKELEGKKTQAQGWQGPKQAGEAIVTSRKKFLEKRASAAATQGRPG